MTSTGAAYQPICQTNIVSSLELKYKRKSYCEPEYEKCDLPSENRLILMSLK